MRNKWAHTAFKAMKMVTISKTRPQYAQTSAGHPLESQSARQVKLDNTYIIINQ